MQGRHGPVVVAGENLGQHVGGAVDGCTNRLFFFRPGPAEDPGQYLFGLPGMADADAQAPELRRTEMTENAAQPVVSAVAAALFKAHGAGRQVQLIVGDQHAFDRHLVEVHGRAQRLTGLVHEGFGRQNDHVDAVQLRPGGSPLELAVVLERQAVTPIQFVHKPEPGVVPGSFVLRAGIAQAGDQPGTHHSSYSSLSTFLSGAFSLLPEVSPDVPPSPSPSPSPSSPSPSSATSSSSPSSGSSPAASAASASAASSPEP